jgi:hypothetical protein
MASLPPSPKALNSFTDLTDQIVLHSDIPESCGGYANIYRGTWKNGSAEKKVFGRSVLLICQVHCCGQVAIKVLRLFHIHDEDARGKIMKVRCLFTQSIIMCRR